MARKEEFEVYVGGLSWCTSERALQDAFSCFGKIIDTRVIIDRFGRSRGYGFITFANRRGMDNAIREMNGQELDQGIITVSKAKQPKMKGEYVEPCFSRGYLSGGRDSSRRASSLLKMEEEDIGPEFERGYLSRGRDSFRRGGRSAVHDVCYDCGCLGHWARDCPSVGRREPSFSSRSWFERDDSEDSCGEDRDRYMDKLYDGGRHRVNDRLDNTRDKDGCYNYHHSDRMASRRGTSNADSSCSLLVDCEVGNVTVRLTNRIHKHCQKLFISP